MKKEKEKTRKAESVLPEERTFAEDSFRPGLSFTQKARTRIAEDESRLLAMKQKGRKWEARLTRPFLASPYHLHYIFLRAFPFLYFVMPIYGFRAVSLFMQPPWEKERTAPLYNFFRPRCFAIGKIRKASFERLPPPM